METSAKINIPPLSVQKDEITISGDKEAVAVAKEKILMIYKEKVDILLNYVHVNLLLPTAARLSTVNHYNCIYTRLTSRSST